MLAKLKELALQISLTWSIWTQRSTFLRLRWLVPSARKRITSWLLQIGTPRMGWTLSRVTTSRTREGATEWYSRISTRTTSRCSWGEILRRRLLMLHSVLLILRIHRKIWTKIDLRLHIEWPPRTLIWMEFNSKIRIICSNRLLITNLKLCTITRRKTYKLWIIIMQEIRRMMVHYVTPNNYNRTSNKQSKCLKTMPYNYKSNSNKSLKFKVYLKKRKLTTKSSVKSRRNPCMLTKTMAKKLTPTRENLKSSSIPATA